MYLQGTVRNRISRMVMVVSLRNVSVWVPEGLSALRPAGRIDGRELPLGFCLT
ncbi:gp102 [Erwinia phage vB_EamP-S6]|uniref:Gp102 n=1 Tax=Erwinia phage vB_EamP-S6 TaxID=1051675 RepID=G0YQJ4_9CAUD|nr:gp102 [Erwinia phage vB_EamP-S6]AEJ81621.1 gp102 [Erwinia phage vB_EamP-S6]